MKDELKISEASNFKGFKLISFKLQGDKLFGDIQYDFVDEKDIQDKIYTTVIIGQNGTLKSRLFQKIILLFWSLQNLKNDKKVNFSEKFHLKYALDNSIYEFSNIFKKGEEESPFEPQPTFLLIDGNRKHSFKEAELPSSIIATAIMLTDRFPFPDPEKFSSYQYLGSRYRPQLASTKTFIGRVVEFVSKNLDSNAFISGVRRITKEFLPESQEPYITYFTQNTPRFFKGKMKVEEFYSYYDEIELNYKDKSTNPPFKLGHYKSIIKKDPDLAKKIVEYCNLLKENNELRSFPRTSSKAISFNLLSENDVEKIRERFLLLDHMRMLGIIYPAQIEFLKSITENEVTRLDGYSIIESSSGEHNLFGSMIGIIASIQPNSLVFIDEPEISLHPNWQMKYLSFLRELLSDEKFSSCHIVIATHSHFLISDLKGENSKIIGLKRTGKGLEIIDFPKELDTYGWSAEDVLYNVFNVVSTRNKFVAEDIAKILNELSAGDKNKVNKLSKEKYDELLELEAALKDNDPLKRVVKTILTKVTT
jgi:hypothetical protein